MAIGGEEPVIEQPPIVDPPIPRKRVDSSLTTRERGEFTIRPDGTAIQHWLVKDESGAVVAQEALTLTQAEVNAMLDDPREKVASADGTKRTPLRHIRQAIQDVRQTRRADVVRTYTAPLVDIY